MWTNGWSTPVPGVTTLVTFLRIVESPLSLNSSTMTTFLPSEISTETYLSSWLRGKPANGWRFLVLSVLPKTLLVSLTLRI